MENDMQNRSNRSINVSGSFQGIASTGDNSVIQNNWNHSKDKDVAEIMVEILGQLAQRYPKASKIQKQTVFQMEFQQRMRENPTLKARFLSSVKAGGYELVKVLTNNPFVSVPIEMVRAWIESEPS
jgi:hypothetical protein